MNQNLLSFLEGSDQWEELIIVSCTEILFPESWVHLLVDVEPIDTTKSKIRRRMYYYLQQGRRTLGIFPKAVSPQTAQLGKV